jgi:hypothetical protein
MLLLFPHDFVPQESAEVVRGAIEGPAQDGREGMEGPATDMQDGMEGPAGGGQLACVEQVVTAFTVGEEQQFPVLGLVQVPHVEAAGGGGAFIDAPLVTGFVSNQFVPFVLFHHMENRTIAKNTSGTINIAPDISGPTNIQSM